jgi:hypothetical protein
MVSISMCSTSRHGPQRRISSVLNDPTVVSARALSKASPTDPTDGSTPASTSRPVNAIDVYWAAGVVVRDQAGQVGDAFAGTGVDRVLEGVEDQLGSHRLRGAPTDDPSGERVDHERDVDHPGPGRAIREVRHPQTIGSRRVEATVDQIREPFMRRIGNRGAVFAAVGRALPAVGPHQPFDRAPGDVMTLAA